MLPVLSMVLVCFRGFGEEGQEGRCGGGEGRGVGKGERRDGPQAPA